MLLGKIDNDNNYNWKYPRKSTKIKSIHLLKLLNSKGEFHLEIICDKNNIQCAAGILEHKL